MMTPLGSAGGLQERVRVVAVVVAVGTVRIPGAKKRIYYIHVQVLNSMCLTYLLVLFLQQLKLLHQCCLTDK